MNLFHEVEECYAAMSPWARRKYREAGRDYAKNWPGPKTVPLLTLVDKPSPMQLPPGRLNSIVNEHPPILVRKTVDN
jgi:hypothetical protein